jgi:Excreted virulence factor EspC, type VII ESX diderm
MAPREPLTVTPPALVAHADALFRVSSDVAAAGATGQRVALDSGAYGHIAVAIPIAMGVLQSKVAAAIAAAAHNCYDGGVNLRAAAGNYQTSDADAAMNLASTRTRVAR